MLVVNYEFSKVFSVFVKNFQINKIIYKSETFRKLRVSCFRVYNFCNLKVS
jgi:hypothetical protein